ncbi:NPC1 (predicted) [Pycnogonum litorale]
MYGSAQSDSGGGLFAAFTGGSLLNKVYNGPPKAFDDPEDIKKLKELCPDLYKGSNSLTCCDHDQLDKLYFQLGKLAGSLLNSCPSCYYNYKQTFCQMVCSPEQSKFINVDETEDSTSGALVSSVDYYLSDTFARGMYDSCKNVRMTGSNNKAFQALCIYSGPSCTHVQLLGDASRLSPFKLNFKLGDKPVVSGDKRFTPLNKKIIPCHEKFDGRPCSCTDCPKVCPVFPDYPENLGKPRARTVMGYDAMVVISVILFCLFCCVVVSVVVYTYAWARPRAAEEQRKPLSKTMTGDDLGSFEEVEPLRSNNSMHPEGSVASTPDVEMMPGDDFCFAEKLGARFESSLRSMFTSWGEMCACRPFIVISVGLIVSFVLGCGCIYFQVVTDPVELWAAAGSRSRIERDYFNEHFE